MENSTIFSDPVRIFISRKLQPQSPLFTIDRDIEWFDQSMIEFEAKPFEWPTQTRALFFYSRKGVQFFFHQLDYAQRSVIKTSKLYCMGSGTANELESQGLTATRIGNGDPIEWADWLMINESIEDICFIKGVQSRRSVEKLIWARSDRTTQAVEVYYQNPKPALIPDQDIYIFTSPLNVRTFAELNDVPPSAQIIAIGPTTREEIVKIWGDITVYTAKEPSESSISELILEQLLKP